MRGKCRSGARRGTGSEKGACTSHVATRRSRRAAVGNLGGVLDPWTLPETGVSGIPGSPRGGSRRGCWWGTQVPRVQEREIKREKAGGCGEAR